MNRKPLFIGAIVVAILGTVAVIGVPAGWYSSKKVAAAPTEAQSTQPQPTQSAQAETPAQPQPTSTEPEPTGEDAAALAAKRQKEKERKAREAKLAESATAAASTQINEGVKPGGKRVVVTVTYDESGRVTQASGGDANALRIARQKRFPPGKPGSATISIPIN